MVDRSSEDHREDQREGETETVCRVLPGKTEVLLTESDQEEETEIEEGRAEFLR